MLFAGLGFSAFSAVMFLIFSRLYGLLAARFVSGISAGIFTGTATAAERSTRLGPIARKDLLVTLHDLVLQSIHQGATCALGGELPRGPGYFYPSTVLEDLAPGMPAYDEELFGPVASLIKVKDEAEAIRVANDSRYGLGGGIFSQDEQHAIDNARNLFDTGMVNINGHRPAQPQLPFGGVKEFVNIKSVMIIE